MKALITDFDDFLLVGWTKQLQGTDTSYTSKIGYVSTSSSPHGSCFSVAAFSGSSSSMVVNNIYGTPTRTDNPTSYSLISTSGNLVLVNNVDAIATDLKTAERVLSPC